MLAASLVGVLLLCAVVPGYIYAQGTSQHRAPKLNQSGLEEAISLIASGFVFTLPTVIAASIICPERISTVVQTLRGAQYTSTDDIRTTAIVLAAMTGCAVTLSWVAATIYRCRHERISGESTWHEILGGAPSGHAAFAEVELKDGRVLRGQVSDYDGIPLGLGRDLALGDPLSYYSSTQPVTPLPGDRLMVPESEIRTITVTHVPVAE
ncbi:DUF6338 family protein [Aeromicrobium sp. IC_218]|uniref:DUF6338 family protein n=1 Tax=Aeromicrobium sp. IC_218 TaxID=2545468 RepID=UPI0010392793|nr:DUF6338 family protein [Aeromicrobium sp. IC_218]TCJ00139.1 hypothetical protein E0W78_02790 [Aeromicrobium sp. IC_218]